MDSYTAMALVASLAIIKKNLSNIQYKLRNFGIKKNTLLKYLKCHIQNSYYFKDNNVVLNLNTVLALTWQSCLNSKLLHLVKIIKP